MTTAVSGSLNIVCSSDYCLFTIGLSVSLSHFQSDSTVYFTCTSTGLPPITVTWSKDGVEMSSEDKFTLSQRVMDVDNIVYESILIIKGESVCDVQGLYQCSVQCFNYLGALVNSSKGSVNVTGELGQVIIHKTIVYKYENLLWFKKIDFLTPVSTRCAASSAPSTSISLTETHTFASSSFFPFASPSMKALPDSSTKRPLLTIQAPAKMDAQFETPSKTTCEHCFQVRYPNIYFVVEC